MSKYYVNKFLFQVDRDPELLARYKRDPEQLVSWWEKELGPQLGNGSSVESTSWLSLSEEERAALVDHDYVKLFECGAHYFLTLTIFIALYEEEYQQRSGPLSFQHEYAAKLAHWQGLEYPSVEL